MDGKIYLSPLKILQDISINRFQFSEDHGYLSGPIKYFVLAKFIYFNSIINLNDYYKTCTLISYKTSNNQEQIDKMPYYIFSNYVAFLNEIIEEENKGQKGNSNDNDPMANAQNTMKNTMSGAKNMMSGMKLPKF